MNHLSPKYLHPGCPRRAAAPPRRQPLAGAALDRRGQRQHGRDGGEHAQQLGLLPGKLSDAAEEGPQQHPQDVPVLSQGK